MSSDTASYRDQLIEEIEATPEEYLPTLLSIVQVFRKSLILKPAESSFRQGWGEAMTREAMAVDQFTQLWKDTEKDG